MKSGLHSFAATALAGLVLALSNAALAAPAALSSTATFVPGEVLVKFKSGVTKQAGTATVAAMGGTVHASLNASVLHVKLNPGQAVEAAVAAYATNPNVEYAQPNYIYHITAATPSPATQYGQLWGFKNTGQNYAPAAIYQQPGSWIYTPSAGPAGNDMHIEPAWGVITNCSAVTVAVVDSGVNYNQVDLAANMWNGNAKHGYNFTAEGAATDPMDLNGHGTHVAGIIGASGTTTTGVCWKASIMAVRVMDSAGTGTTATITQGLNYAVANGAKVVNMSLGAPNFDQLFSNAITNAQNNDVVVVVAAGNNASNNDVVPTYPCNFTQPNLICVAALDQAYNLATFSDWGATSVHVGAPGTNILSTWAGTSAVITDTLNAAAAWTFTGGGWGYGTWTSAVATNNMIADPATWPAGVYAANANQKVYKTFNLSAVNAATLNFYLGGVVNVGDTFAGALSPAGGDPFTAASGVVVASGFFNSPGAFFPMSGNITQCLTATCTLGFQLKSAPASLGAMGPAVTFFSINTLTLGNTSYNTENGTSMASPEVAGLATMLRAYNPLYTSADVVAAIKNAGRPTASLAGKTTTGMAVDVAASLAYINQPTGLAATVH